MVPLHLCRTASSYCPPGSWQDTSECRGSFACVIGGLEKSKRTLYFAFPHLPEQQWLPTRFNSPWAGVRDIREVLQRVAAFFCEKHRTALNDLNAFQVYVLKTIPAALTTPGSLHWRDGGPGGGGGTRGEQNNDARTRRVHRALLLPEYGPRCFGVSRIPAKGSAAHSPAPGRAPLTHASERCEMAAAARGAARRKRRLSRSLSLPARAAIAE